MSPANFLPDAPLEDTRPCGEPPESDPPDCRSCGDTGWRDLEGGESALCECAVRKQAEWRAVVADHRNDAARDDALTDSDVPF